MTGYQCHCLEGYSGKQCMVHEQGNTESSESRSSEPSTTTNTTMTLTTGGTNTTESLDPLPNCAGLSRCPHGWLPGEGKCYSFPKKRVRILNEAVNDCDKRSVFTYRGTVMRPSLMVPESESEVQILWHCVLPHIQQRKSHQCYWINCKRVSDGDGKFSCRTTRRGNTTDYRNWVEGEPDNWDNSEDCAIMNDKPRHLEWSDIPCNYIFHYCDLYYACQIHVT
ncbi:C-type lectin-like [Lytechinus variegatus]|uniref:C-type lectin-like n=1 Tax=Lytechinus variegatus TaxID=7654 RepID=UPI001BB298D9|nr:C-type lectin-like [Lytechinus variegatus]